MVVDFANLRITKERSKPIDPLEIFRRLPKPPEINDLYTSQAEVLQSWFSDRSKRDTVIKLHTGGGKTLVGLLIAQSTLNETNVPVLYLVPTKQLVIQTVEKAKTYGIPAIGYQGGQPINEEFINSKAILVSTYKALFNGKSKFGIRGAGQPQKVSSIILDDAHVAFSAIRESFTIEIKSESDRDRYKNLVDLFRLAFKEVDNLGKFDDIVSGSDRYEVLEVPYWAWRGKLDAVREELKSNSDSFEFGWPLLRDRLHMCHALISHNRFTVTPILPFVNIFSTFYDAPRRIYMSATIADDSEIIRTFGADKESVENPLTSRSLAGISERMIMIPNLMEYIINAQTAIEELIKWTSEQNLGIVILVPSKKACNKWSKVANVAENTDEVTRHVKELQAKISLGPVVFANRYDGIDLPGDTCRLLIMDGLPKGTSDYEIFRANALYDSSTITRILAQRIEQGIGRGARGSGDHCVVLLASKDLAGWISKDANFRFLTSATKAQIEMGIKISKEIKDYNDLKNTIRQSYERDLSWTTYHAEMLPDLIDKETLEETEQFSLAAVERKAFDLWQDSFKEQAISKIQNAINSSTKLDQQERGWMEQLAARIADDWGNNELAEKYQIHAYTHNRNLLRPKTPPPYRPLTLIGEQAKSIAKKVGKYKQRRGFLTDFEEVVIHLNHSSSAKQFEQALMDLAQMIGFSAERHDVNGVGPDVLWLLPTKVGFVIEAKSRKKEKNALTKEEHGQLLVAAEWFKKNYPEYECVRISVHPKNLATKAAVAGATHALTYGKLASLVSDARILLTSICESQLPDSEIEAECSRLLAKSNLNADRLMDSYLILFKEKDPS